MHHVRFGRAKALARHSATIKHKATTQYTSFGFWEGEGERVLTDARTHTMSFVIDLICVNIYINVCAVTHTNEQTSE